MEVTVKSENITGTTSMTTKQGKKNRPRARKIRGVGLGSVSKPQPRLAIPSSGKKKQNPNINLAKKNVGTNQNQKEAIGNNGKNERFGNGSSNNSNARRGPARGGDGDFFIMRRLEMLSGPTHDLPPIVSEECKFSSRSRLYVGNLPNDIKEADLRELFKPFGEVGEVFLNSEKNFAFLRLDYHINAERAKREIDGFQYKGRVLRIRFAPNSTIMRVKNLSNYVSNELLHKSFEVFGPIERAVIIVDDRGKPTGEGIVEFSKKSSCQNALRLCSERCFFLTSSLRPCFVEPFEIHDETDGLPEKSIIRRNDFYRERDTGPRFANINSFDHEYGSKWKQLHEFYLAKQEALKREMKLEESKLEAQMEFARFQHETDQLKKELLKREQNNDRIKMQWEMREKHATEQLQREEEQMQQQQIQMLKLQEEEMLRQQQEDVLIMQARKLNSILEAQEINQGGFSFDNHFDNFGGGNNSMNMDRNQQDQRQFNNVFDLGNNRVQQNKANNRKRKNNGGTNISNQNRRGGFVDNNRRF